jgi:hypothetical protein
MIVFVFFMIRVLMPPAPVVTLLSVLQLTVVNIGLVPFVPPLTVSPVLAIVPVVVILVIAIVDPPLLLLLLVTLMIVLWRQCSRGQRCHQCGHYGERS